MLLCGKTCFGKVMMIGRGGGWKNEPTQLNLHINEENFPLFRNGGGRDGRQAAGGGAGGSQEAAPLQIRQTDGQPFTIPGVQYCSAVKHICITN